MIINIFVVIQDISTISKSFNGNFALDKINLKNWNHLIIKKFFIGILGGVLLLIIIIIFFTCRYFSKNKGEYLTNEAKGAENYDDANNALVQGRTGQPDISQKEEYLC